MYTKIEIYVLMSVTRIEILVTDVKVESLGPATKKKKIESLGLNSNKVHT